VGHLFAKLMYLPPIRGLGMFVRVYEVETNPGLVGMPSETVTGLLHSTFKPDEPVIPAPIRVEITPPTKVFEERPALWTAKV